MLVKCPYLSFAYLNCVQSHLWAEPAEFVVFVQEALTFDDHTVLLARWGANYPLHYCLLFPINELKSGDSSILVYNVSLQSQQRGWSEFSKGWFQPLEALVSVKRWVDFPSEFLFQRCAERVFSLAHWIICSAQCSHWLSSRSFRILFCRIIIALPKS